MIYTAGDKIGKLTLIKVSGFLKCSAGPIKLWECKCECGVVETKTVSNAIRSKKIGTGCSQCGMKQKVQKRIIHD